MESSNYQHENNKKDKACLANGCSLLAFLLGLFDQVEVFAFLLAFKL